MYVALYMYKTDTLSMPSPVDDFCILVVVSAIPFRFARHGIQVWMRARVLKVPDITSALLLSPHLIPREQRCSGVAPVDSSLLGIRLRDGIYAACRPTIHSRGGFGASPVIRLLLARYRPD